MEAISLTELASLAIVGTFVSLIVQFIKANSFSDPGMLRVYVITLSLIAGGAYYFLQETSFWTAFVGIVAIANTIFLFIIKPLEDAGAIEG